AGDAARLRRGRDVAMIDLGGTDRLGSPAGTLLHSVPAFGAFEYFHLSQYSQGIDAATRAAARSAYFYLAGAGVGDLIDRAVDRDDLGDPATRRLRAKTSSLAGRLPGCLQPLCRR